MNYEARIEALKEKGIFSKEQAQRLGNSFQKREENHTPQRERKYLLEVIGAIVLGVALLYIFISVGSADATSGVEDVSRSLNAPVHSGMSGKSSFVLVLVLLVVSVYGVLYLYAHKRFRMFWHTAEEMAVLEEGIHRAEVMKKELSQTLERLLTEEREPEGVVDSTSIREEVMETFKEMEAHLLSQKEKLERLKQKCRHRQQVFPDTLAKLVGKLPLCQ